MWCDILDICERDIYFQRTMVPLKDRTVQSKSKYGGKSIVTDFGKKTAKDKVLSSKKA